MALEYNANQKVFTASAAQTVFSFGEVLYFDQEHLLVYVDGELKTLGTDYTVSPTTNTPNGTPGGTVTFADPMVGDEQVIIMRQVPLVQEIDYEEFGKFPANTHERGLDYLTMIAQQHEEMLDRSIIAEVGESVDLTLPSIADRANKHFAWDSGGLPIAVEAESVSGTSVLATGSTTERLLAERFSDEYNVLDYGLVGNNTVDDAPAFQNLVNILATAGGGTIVFPGGGRNYKFATGIINLGNNLKVKMSGGSQIIKAFNGDLFTTGPQSNMKFEDMFIDAKGDTYTGAVMRFSTNSQYIEWSGGRIVNGADSIWLFEDMGGYECNIHDIMTELHSSQIATGAVVKRTLSTLDSQAAPRHFHHIFALSGTWFANVDGFHGAYFDHVYCAGITIGDNSLGNTLNNCRLAIPNGMTAHISGNSTLVTACEIGGDLTVDAGFEYGEFYGNIMDPSKTFTDNSPKTGSAASRVDDPQDHTVASSGTWTPSIGGTATYGVQIGSYTKTGKVVVLQCHMSIVTRGTGSTSIISGLPFPAATGGPVVICPVWFSGSAVNLTAAFGVISSGGSTIQMNGLAAAAASMSSVAMFQNSTAVAFTVTYHTD